MSVLKYMYGLMFSVYFYTTVNQMLTLMSSVIARNLSPFFLHTEHWLDKAAGAQQLLIYVNIYIKLVNRLHTHIPAPAAVNMATVRNEEWAAFALWVAATSNAAYPKSLIQPRGIWMSAEHEVTTMGDCIHDNSNKAAAAYSICMRPRQTVIVQEEASINVRNKH